MGTTSFPRGIYKIFTRPGKIIRSMNPSAFYLFSAIFGLNILFISCANLPQPGQGRHIMDLPESIVDMLSGFIGPNNHLPSANRRFYHTCSEVHPIHKHIADKLGIPELANYPGVNSEILDLLKLPEFEYDEDMEKYLINDIYKYGKHQIIKDAILSKCLELIFEIGEDYINERSSELFSVFFEHGSSAVKLKFLDLLPRPVARKYFAEYLHMWRPEQATAFFEQILTHPNAAYYLSLIMDLGSLEVVTPFFIIYGVPEGIWINSFVALDQGKRFKAFYNFVKLYIYPLSNERVGALENFLRNHPELIHKNAIVRLIIHFRVMGRAPNSIVNFSKIIELSLQCVTFAMFHDAQEVARKILSEKPEILRYLLSNIMESIYGTHLQSSLSKEHSVAKVVKIFLIISKALSLPPNSQSWIGSEIFVSGLVEGLLGLFKIDQMHLDAKNNVLQFTGHLIDEKQRGFLPENAIFYLPITKLIVEKLFRGIKTQNHDILRALLSFRESTSLPHFGPRIILSSSFLRAIQESEEFYHQISDWCDEELVWDLSPADVQVLSHPVDRLKGTTFVTVMGEDFLINTAEQFERLVELFSAPTNSAGHGTVLDLYNDIWNYESSEESDFGLLFYQKYRNFFHCWIRSKYWKKLSFIDDTKIYDYMELDYPRRMRKIRLLRANRTVQKSNYMDIADDNNMIESYQNQLD